jgi:hypothetical protein
VSTEVTAPSTYARAFAWLRSTLRTGQAMSDGFSPAVAT